MDYHTIRCRYPELEGQVALVTGRSRDRAGPVWARRRTRFEQRTLPSTAPHHCPAAVNWAAHARRMDADLRAHVLPYWHDTAVDWTTGGYRLYDKRLTVRGALDTAAALLRSLLEPRDSSKGPASREKHLVAQARLLYVFSLAHQRQFSGAARSYLQAAQHGYEFLAGRMVDAEEGGCFWRVDHRGRPLDATKRLYGQAFAIYAMCEYHRASQEPEPLAHALAL